MALTFSRSRYYFCIFPFEVFERSLNTTVLGAM